MDATAELLQEIDTFKTKVKITETQIGLYSLNDGHFVQRLRKSTRRRCWPETARKVRDFMAAAFTHITTADGTVIIRDVETGTTASGRSLPEAYAELRRMVAGRQAA